jgi:hypothetical protein
MWWHGWDRQKDFDQIAGSLICGHLIECAAYVTGKSLTTGCTFNLLFVKVDIFQDSKGSWRDAKILGSPLRSWKLMVAAPSPKSRIPVVR